MADGGAVNYVISMGAFCLTANTLTEAGLRVFAAPLDWVFSSPAMIAHCVADNWTTFLDPAQYRAHAGPDPHVGHRFYSPMVKKPKIFLHRSPLVPEEYAYYMRCVARVRAIASDTAARSLLVLVQSSKHRSAHAVWARQFAALFDALDVHWQGHFELLVVRLQHGKGSVAAEREVEARASVRGNTLRLVYLPCLAPHSAAAFGDPHDREAFCGIVRADRRFSLKTDPLRELTPGARAAVSGGAPPRVLVPAAALGGVPCNPSEVLAALSAEMAPRREGERAQRNAQKAVRAAAYASKRAIVRPNQKLSKAERRVRQEAERAAKAIRRASGGGLTGAGVG